MPTGTNSTAQKTYRDKNRDLLNENKRQKREEEKMKRNQDEQALSASKVCLI
jgi:hypothetical protein